MTRVCPQSNPLIFAAAVISMVGATLGFAQERDSQQDFDRCKAIASDSARLDCLKKLLPNALSDAPLENASTIWRLTRTPRPNRGPDAVAIMRTADTTQSDPDLAGLMIRCQDKPGLEVVLALLRPFPPRSKKRRRREPRRDGIDPPRRNLNPGNRARPADRCNLFHDRTMARVETAVR